MFSSCLCTTGQGKASYSSTQNNSEGVNDEMRDRVLPLLAFENKDKLSISKDLSGDYTIIDEKGNRTTVSKDLSGDYVVRDNEGNRRTISKGVMGDVYY